MYKKIITSILAVTLVAATSVTVVASQHSSYNSTDTSSSVDISTINRSVLTPEEQDAYAKEMVGKLMSGEIKVAKPSEKVSVNVKGWEGVYVVSGEPIVGGESTLPHTIPTFKSSWEMP